MSTIIIWFFSKGISYKLSHISTSLDITQHHLECLGVRNILAGYLGCMVSCLCDDIGIKFPQGSILNMHGL